MSQQINPDIELGELKLKVSNLERSIRFYQEVVGFKVLTQDANAAELTVDGEKALLVLEEIPNALITPRRSSAGLYHFAILLPTRKDLGLSLRNLIDSGVHIGQADHLVSEALYISDPDHNGIEIYRDRPRESWRRDAEGNILMASDPIDWEGLLDEAKDGEWGGLPSATAIGHVHFHVSDIQKAKQFYCDLFGFDIVLDGINQMGALFISAGGYHHHIGLNIWAGAGAPIPPFNGTGLLYYTIKFPNQSELEKTLNQLRHAGISAIEHDQAWVVHDPSNIGIRLVHN
jgi:catechol 2,3-dioxygenase